MLTTGNQLRAARALAGMDQGTLAERAGVNINTIGSMEKRGNETLTSGLDKVKAVMSVLEAEGVEFLNHGQPGVRLMDPVYRTCLTELVVASEADFVEFALKQTEIAFQKYVTNSRGPAQVGVWTRRRDLVAALQSIPQADTPAGRAVIKWLES